MGFLKKLFGGGKKKKDKAPPAIDTMNPGRENIGKQHKDAYMGSVLDTHSRKSRSKKSTSPMKDKHVRSQRALGGGSANDVQLMNYKKGIGKTGQKTGFFKGDFVQKDKSDYMQGEGKGIGIKDSDARNSARAVASTRADKFFGAGVTSDDHFARHNGQTGVVSAKTDGVALREFLYSDHDSTVDGMDANMAKENNKMVPGTWDVKEDGAVHKAIGTRFREVDYTDANIHHGIANLQVMDFLTGQIDRHGGNIMVNPTTGKVTGIDNDLAFGSKHQVFGNVVDGKSVAVGKTCIDDTMDFDENDPLRGALPAHVDAELGLRILNSSEDQYEDMLRGEKGDLSFLNEEEIDNAMYRYRRLKAHIDDLYMNDALIYDWSSDEVQNEMLSGSNYLAEHKANYEGAGSRGDPNQGLFNHVRMPRTPNRKIA